MLEMNTEPAQYPIALTPDEIAHPITMRQAIERLTNNRCEFSYIPYFDPRSPDNNREVVVGFDFAYASTGMDAPAHRGYVPHIICKTASVTEILLWLEHTIP